MAEKLKEYCTVISGYAFKSKDLSEGTDIPVIKIGNISNGKNVVIDDSTQYVNEEFLSVDEKYHIKNGDILISLTGSHMNQPNSMVGRCCRNLDDTIYLLNQRAGKIIPNKSVDKDFLYYVFRLPSIQYAIANRAYGGANQVNVSPKDVMGILRCMRSYQDAASIDLGLIDNAYGNLDFIISNHSIREYAYNDIFDKMRKFVYQFREEAYYFNLLNDGKGNFAVCASKVVDLNKLFFATKDVEAHDYVNTLVYQTAFDEIESELEKFRCKIYKAKYVPIKASPISGTMRYFGEDSETKGTDG